MMHSRPSSKACVQLVKNQLLQWSQSIICFAEMIDITCNLVQNK